MKRVNICNAAREIQTALRKKLKFPEKYPKIH